MKEVVDGCQAKLQLITIIAIVAVIVLITILASVPPISRDALIHHLAVPKIYIQHGGMVEIPSMDFSYYPMNLDLLYLIPVYLNQPVVAKYIHFTFALLTAWLIYQYLKRHLSKTYGLLGALFFLTIPIIVKLSVTAYVDLGLIFFTWGSIFYVLKWIDSSFRFRYLIVSAVFCGLALGTKYNGLIVLLILVPTVVLLYSIILNKKLTKEQSRTRNINSMKGMGCGLVFFVVSVLVFSPWMMRNASWTGNPVYPLFNGFFSPKPVEQMVGPREVKRPPRNAFWMRKNVYKESFFQTLTIPIRAFFQGQDDNPKYFDGKLNPALLLLSFAAFLGLWKKNDNEKLTVHRNVLAWFALLFVLFVLFKVDFRIRYMSPAIPAMVILSVFGLKNIVEKRKKRQPFIWFESIFIALLLISVFPYNLKYMVDQFNYIQPMSYLCGIVDHETYISRYRIENPIVNYANRTLPEDARVLCLSVGKRTYYVERDVHLALDFYKKEEGRYTEQMITRRLKRYGTTHIIFNKYQYLQRMEHMLPSEMAVFQKVFNSQTTVLQEINGVQLLFLTS